MATGPGAPNAVAPSAPIDTDEDAIDAGHHAWGADEVLQATTAPFQTRVGVDAGVVIVNRKELDIVDLRQKLRVPLPNPIDSDDQERVHREQLYEPEERNQSDVCRGKGQDQGDGQQHVLQSLYLRDESQRDQRA